MKTDNFVSELKVSYNPEIKANDRPKITNTLDAYNIVKPFYDETMEYIETSRIIMLDGGNGVIAVAKIGDGSVNGCVFDPKLTFQKCLLAHASSFIAVHNHPSGRLKPSDTDIRLTKKLKEVGKVLDLPIVDHLIVSVDGYYSFADECML